MPFCSLCYYMTFMLIMTSLTRLKKRRKVYRVISKCGFYLSPSVGNPFATNEDRLVDVVQVPALFYSEYYLA